MGEGPADPHSRSEMRVPKALGRPRQMPAPAGDLRSYKKKYGEVAVSASPMGWPVPGQGK